MRFIGRRVEGTFSIVVVILLMCSFLSPLTQFEVVQTNHSSRNFAQSTMDEHICLDVPWQMMRGPLGFSCPASLSMVFEYYGVIVEQDDIFVESFSSRFWPLGTNPDNFPRAASFQDYNGEDWGFQGTTMTLGHLNYEERIEFVKRYIRDGIPVVAIVMGQPGWPCHFKVIIGFDERTGNWFFNDPWYEAPDPNGPMSIDSYLEDRLLEGKWSRTNYTIGLAIPIRLSLEIESRPIEALEEFDVLCKVNGSYLDLDSDVSLDLTLPEGYSLVSGVPTPEVVLVENEAQYTWRVRASSLPSEVDKIRVLATAARENYTTGGFSEAYPSIPEKPIIQKPYTDFPEDNPAFSFDLYSEIDYSGTYSAEVAVFRSSDAATFYPNIYTVETPDDAVNITLEPFRPGKTIFCWVNVITPFGNYSSERSVYLISESDWDGDGLEGYREVYRCRTDPYHNDTDRDFLSDYEEVDVYFTDPLLNDTDADSLLDGLEIAAGTDPRNPDSDSDGDLDGIEVQYGLDPLDPESNVALFQQTQILLIVSVGIVSIVAIVIVVWRKIA